MTPKILAETLSSMIEEVTPAQLKLMPKQDVIALGMLQNMLNIQMLQVEILDDIAKRLNPNKEAEPEEKAKIAVMPKAPYYS